MGNTVKTHIKLTDGKAKLSATSEGRALPPVVVDFHPPTGTREGYDPMELVLFALESCSTTTVVSILRNRMGRTVTGMEATATGVTRDHHPKSFSHIDIFMTVTSPDAQDEAIAKALPAVEEKLCPVWDMLRSNVEVNVTYSIHRE